MCRHIPCLALFLFGLSCEPFFAQEAVYESRVDLVRLGVSVVDEDGSPVTDLRREDFQVFENDEPQIVQYFSNDIAADITTIPFHLGLLFDTSGSMEREGRFAKTAAIKFFNTVTYAEDITLVDFDSEVRVGRYSQADFPRLVERIRRSQSDGDTALYDALGVYLDGAFSQDGRKVLLLYTDGADTRSRTKFSEALDLIRASDVTIYAIGFQKYLRSSQRTLQRMRLEQLVDLTGGRSYFPNDVDDLEEIYKKISDELDARYSLGYESNNFATDGTWRDVTVKIVESRKELERLRVKSRKGYFAPFIEP